MYAGDHNDTTLGPIGDTQSPGWCNGAYNETPDGVTTRILTNSPTYPYVGTVDSFKCAADRSKLRYEGRPQPRVISYAANAYLVPAAVGLKTAARTSRACGRRRI